ncbi:probable tRNA (uracil-O(2)-)-methyltransferase isoform X2 [Varroa jacobsoni]|nr:probable tRNA (uracil-O(2)-)-methyltransferase isoform X2 [Varroa jacobsoni]
MSSQPSTKSAADDAVKLRLIKRSQPIPSECFPSIAWIFLTKPHVFDGRLAGGDILVCQQDSSQQRVPVSASVPQLSQNDILRLRRILVPKNHRRFSGVYEECRLQLHELSIFTERSADDQGSNLEPVVRGPFKFVLRFDDNDKCVSLSTSSDPCPRLTTKLFDRIERWAHGVVRQDKQIQVASLGLVSVERYSRIYWDLKLKYGPELIKIWPEKTDPLKFVFEDLAIASYLIALWDPEDDGRKTSFVDIGCGNGLLVYILILEGHMGLGIDVRKRRIWSLYPPKVSDFLREEPVTPQSRFDAEWWIGNHSDELTPWIPLLASMSSSTAKVFLLPCCPYGLYGKYQRTKPDLSQYQSYLIHLKEDFLPKCGFKVRIDKIRIPSTKRICMVLSERLDEPRDQVIARLRHRLEKEKPVTDFVPRAKEIPVRNCTQTDRSLTDRIVHRVAIHLLTLPDKEQSEGFNLGGQLSLAEVIALVNKRERSLLKSQCGGIQTLLKNNYHVFQVKNGAVRLKIPEEQKPNAQRSVRQRRACWFDSNHPQGCPLEQAKCRFSHRDKFNT